MIRKSTLAALVGVVCFTSALAEVEDNTRYRNEYQAWAASHLALLPTAFLPGPFGTAADLATIGIDIRLKYLPASFVAPTPPPVKPDSPDGCTYSLELPRKEGEYQNLLGLFDVKSLPDWGLLGTPGAGHGNSEVKVSVDSPFLDDWSEAARTVVFPSGNHRLTWRADTQLDVVFDVVIPAVLFVITAELKYGDAITKTEPKTAARAAAIGKEFLKSAALEVGVVTAGSLASAAPVAAATHKQSRTFTVYDINPPEIETSETNPAPIEAIDFGGIRWDRIADDLRATITAEDPCGLSLLVGNDAPFVVPIGTTPVTWTASDIGPLPPDGSNPGFDSVIQNVVVQDTLAPILLAPPSRVIESMDPAQVDDIDVGSAVVFDLADPEPLISSDVPSDFPVDSRTEITWTATDGSGNSSSKSQWVTVKAPGTNNPPSVQDTSAESLTAQPVDIELTGSDPDLISGRFDPLKFDIVAPPANGFFVAPLVPYFIEDYRVKPTDEVGEILNTSSNPANDFYDQFCQQAREIPIDFVYQPEFVHVTDSGIQFILDRYWVCQASNAETRPRISKWSATGDLLGQRDIADSIKRITLDRDGFVYAVTPGTASDPLFLTKYDADFNLLQSWKLDAGTPFGSPPNRMLHARLDSATGVIYATDKNRVYAYDGGDGQEIPGYLGVLKDGEQFLSGAPSVAGSSSRGFYMEIDSAGFIYVVDSGLDRIHQFEPSTLEGATFTPGGHVGWLGRCDSGPNCDDENRRSFGFSCTDATCEVVEADGTNCGAFTSGPCSHGSGQGQFSTPIGIALDPDDILYVTDYDNFRVQRFTPLGDFAGEAASTCDGSCFVLGDMGRPLDISVNATQFFVLDRDFDLMHVFETAPFKDITENSVIVSYASDNGFQGTDTFTFRANDGLENSNVGTATITVSRNFRPPVAIDETRTLDEDSSLSFDLPAADPDGIAGVDFNGLDTLTSAIVSGPDHGQLTGTGTSLTYTPDPDFNGEDAFTFTVDDGVFTSEPATVTLEVTPVNDLPVVRLTDDDAKLMPKGIWPLLESKIAAEGKVAGLGFPLPLMAEYEDPDFGQPHYLTIDWGDGAEDTASEAPPDPEVAYEGPVIAPTYQGLGQVVAEHAYSSTGAKTIETCIVDQGGEQGCTTATITVEPMVDLNLEDATDRSDLPLPGFPTTLEINVVNSLPVEGVTGLSASEVTFTGTAPPGVMIQGASIEQGNCTHIESVTTCELGTLDPGAEVMIGIMLLPEPAFDADAAGYRMDVTADEPDASGDNLTTVAVPSLGQTVFADGFEVE